MTNQASQSSHRLNRNQLLSEVDHALKLPLNAVLNRAELILMGVEGEISEAVRMDAQVISDEIQRLSATVESLLAFVRIEATSPVRTVFNFSEVVSDIGRELQPEAEPLRIKLNDDIDDTAVFVEAEVPVIAEAIRSLLRYFIAINTSGDVFVNVVGDESYTTVAISESVISECSVSSETPSLPRYLTQGQRSLDLLTASLLIERNGGELLINVSTTNRLELSLKLPSTR